MFLTKHFFLWRFWRNCFYFLTNLWVCLCFWRNIFFFDGNLFYVLTDLFGETSFDKLHLAKLFFRWNFIWCGFKINIFWQNFFFIIIFLFSSSLQNILFGKTLFGQTSFGELYLVWIENKSIVRFSQGQSKCEHFCSQLGFICFKPHSGRLYIQETCLKEYS